MSTINNDLEQYMKDRREEYDKLPSSAKKTVNDLMGALSRMVDDEEQSTESVKVTQVEKELYSFCSGMFEVMKQEVQIVIRKFNEHGNVVESIDVFIGRLEDFLHKYYFDLLEVPLELTDDSVVSIISCGYITIPAKVLNKNINLITSIDKNDIIKVFAELGDIYLNGYKSSGSGDMALEMFRAMNYNLDKGCNLEIKSDDGQLMKIKAIKNAVDQKSINIDNKLTDVMYKAAQCS